MAKGLRRQRLFEGQRNAWEYDPNGIDLLQVKQKNPASPGGFDVLSSYTYNSLHEPLTLTDAAGQTTTYTYDGQGQILTVTTPARAGITENRTTTYTYNPDGSLQGVTGPAAGAASTSTYDGYGRVRTTTDEDGYTLTFDYDALDRPVKTTFPDGTYEQTIYNRLDPQDRRDRLGRWSHVFYDALRRPITISDPLGRTTSQQWCSCGSLDKLVDGDGNATTWQRDLQGRVTQEVRADNATTTYVYENQTSRQKSITDAKNQTKTFSYAADNNPLGITYTNAQTPTANVSFAYDTAYNRRTSMVDGTGTTTYTYVPVGTLGAGSPASVSGPLANSAITYSYDEFGRVIGRQINGTNGLSFSYDVLGRPLQQTNILGAFSYAYDGVTGRAISSTYPTGQTTAYAYFDNLGDRHLQEIWHKRADGSTLSRFDYSYDAAGNILTWSQQQGTDPAKIWSMGYDGGDELASATISGVTPPPAPSRYAWAYDKAGNRAAEQKDDAVTGGTYNNRNELVTQQAGGALLFKGSVNKPATVSISGTNANVTTGGQFGATVPVPSGTSNVTVSAKDYSGNTRTNTYQLSQGTGSSTFVYDANGNLTSDGTRTFTWDAENRLVSVTQGPTTLAAFSYDGQGRRIQKIAGGVTHAYVYDGVHAAEERLSGTQTGTIRYFHGPGADNWLGRQNTDGSLTYFAADHLGSIVSEVDGAGQVTLARSYDPWGNMDATSAATNGAAFTGREWDSEIGLYYYRARYYAPSLGRFINEDPAGIGDGPNPYAYVGNHPLAFVDPTGMKKKIVICQTPGQKGTLNLCDGNKSIFSVTARCGCANMPTPVGHFRAGAWVQNKAKKEYANNQTWEESPWGNPYGPWFLPINGAQGYTHCGIHGTRGYKWLGDIMLQGPDDEKGLFCSHGCVRISNSNIERLHEALPTPQGTSIIIKTSCKDCPCEEN